MKIGIDTFGSNSGKSGVGAYLKEILKRKDLSRVQFELFGWDYDRYVYDEAQLEFIPQCHVSGRTANSLWHIFKYPQFAADRKYCACFFPSAHRRLPGNSPCPTVGTVHDMAAYWGPRRSRESLGAVLRVALPNSLRQLNQIIAVSEWVKQELVELARVKENRIEVVPNGIDLTAFHPRPKNEEGILLIQPFSFRRPYILYVSRIDHPIKNHARLIDAFGIFKERTGHPHRLVLAGADSRGAERVKEKAACSKYRNDIFFTGHFPAESLPELYTGADFVVFPSMYEGFGLGALEAMASGVPVACARSASLPEVAEHAALYFDPLNIEDMADRMVTMTEDKFTYQECLKAGLERAQAFSWEHCAERTLRVIERTAGY